MLLLLLVSLTLTSCSRGEDPGLRLLLTDKGLQTLRHFAAGVVQGKLDEVAVPDVSGTIWGLLRYSLSSLQVVKCDLPEPALHFSPDTSGLVLAVRGLSVALSGDWATRFAFSRDSGTLDLAVLDVSVSSLLRLDRDVSGRLSVSLLSCDADLQSVDLRLHGGDSWMKKWLVKYLNGNMKDRVRNSICPGVKDAVSRLEQHLQAVNVSVGVNSVMSLELPLSAAPAVDSAWINFGFKGEFLSVATKHEPPFVATPFCLATPPDVMVSVGVSEYSANSASFAYYDSGQLQVLINDSMVPSYCPVPLNTSCWGPFVPQLPQMFPDLSMTLQVYARQMPVFSFLPGVVKLQLLSTVKAFAVQKNSSVTPLFALHMDSNFSLKMAVDGEKVKSLMRTDNFTLSLDSSEIGPFKTEALETVAEKGLNEAVKDINVRLQQGFDLPQTEHLQLLNSVLTVNQGFISFFSDAKLQATL